MPDRQANLLMGGWHSAPRPGTGVPTVACPNDHLDLATLDGLSKLADVAGRDQAVPIMDVVVVGRDDPLLRLPQHGDRMPFVSLVQRQSNTDVHAAVPHEGVTSRDGATTIHVLGVLLQEVSHGLQEVAAAWQLCAGRGRRANPGVVVEGIQEGRPALRHMHPGQWPQERQPRLCICRRIEPRHGARGRRGRGRGHGIRPPLEPRRPFRGLHLQQRQGRRRSTAPDSSITAFLLLQR
mmetsp:Transcript_80311/g.259518  ORF Transcript_80311/g.259518 Transcript_80311/m.259518 type:complete len:237 (+) Transcript_80311:416-1126(+)